MEVFKFGGASVSSVERIQQVAKIVGHHLAKENGPLVLVVSAMGKTTNALEVVAAHFFAGEKEAALQAFDAIKQSHLQTAQELLPNAGQFAECTDHLSDIFTEAEWLLHDRPVRNYDYYYDQIVCIGELLSTIILYHFFKSQMLPAEWLDVRDLLRTDDNFRDANVDWAYTQQAISSRQWATGNTQQAIGNGQWATGNKQNESRGLAGSPSQIINSKSKIFLLQGFIGATADNESTTLGREGSDYTAAIFANLLDARNLTIWKDVASVMNADPKVFLEAQPIAHLNYNEVIEMAYYGAQVIHPKTIKPLYQKEIPLLVKCFLNADLPGTVIDSQPVKNLPPIIVYKQPQALLQFRSKDFSFTGETPVGKLYHLFEELSIRPSLTQNGAVSFLCCIDDREDKIEKLAGAAGELFDVSVEKGLTLLTIRHYQTPLLAELTAGKTQVLMQQTQDTVQVLLR